MSDVVPPAGPGGTSYPPPPPPGPPGGAPPPSAPPPAAAPRPSGGSGGSKLPLIIGAVVAVIAVVAGVIIATSGGDDDDVVTTDTTVATTVDGATTTADAGGGEGGMVTEVGQVQSATVQIVARGSFRDPEVGFASKAGSGSGFIIDPSGLAVTNNHVVTGAATLQVYIGGDDTPRNARILGVSECNDLALIDIEGDGYPYMGWYDDSIDTALEVYAAGYPLGDPQFTLTRGIVAKARAGGDLTGTSSIDYTIEHDANIQPGNSGGPLVDESGAVVGVNYAGGDSGQSGTNQFFAIAAPLAEPVVEMLKEGDFESLGINGWAVNDEDAEITGIWVAGVATGSPASDAGIQAGDIVTSLQNLPMGTDGTFADYCDVIRTAGDGAKMAVEVIRFDTQQVLRGELNGKELVESFSFAQELEDEVDTQQGDAYTAYDVVMDDTGRLSVEVPSTWTSRRTAPQEGGTIPAIGASTDLATYDQSYSVPGMEFVLLQGANVSQVDQVLDAIGRPPEECVDAGRQDYSDPLYTGRYHVYNDCGSSGASYITVTAAPTEGGDFLAVLAIQVVTDADLAAIDQILGTFVVL